MNTTFFQKWCHKYWLYMIYAMGIVMLLFTVVFWNDMEVPRRLLGILSVLLPFHVFEENTLPGGFHYIMNTVRKSDDPNAGPLNTVSDMITNLGGELLFLILFLFGGNLGTSIMVAFFGIGESVIHTGFGIVMRSKMKSHGLKTIYNPGLCSSYLTLLPLSIYAVFYLTSSTITSNDVLFGVILVILIIGGLILLPMKVIGKFQPEYAYSEMGFYDKYQ